MAHTLAVPSLLQSHQAAAAQRVLSQPCASAPGGRESCEATTDTLHTGGGAAKVQSSQNPTCKSQVQSLKDTSLDQNPLDPDLKSQVPLSRS